MVTPSARALFRTAARVGQSPQKTLQGHSITPLAKQALQTQASAQSQASTRKVEGHDKRPIAARTLAQTRKTNAVSQNTLLSQVRRVHTPKPPQRPTVDPQIPHSLGGNPRRENAAAQIGRSQKTKAEIARNLRKEAAFHVSDVLPEDADKVVAKLFKNNEPQADYYTDIFSEEATADIDGKRRENSTARREELRFRKEMEEIDKIEDTQERIDALEAFIYDQGEGIERFNADQLNHMYKKFLQLGAHNQMVEMMEQSTNGTFTQNVVNLEFYVRANIRSDYFNPHICESIGRYILDQSPSSAQGLAIIGMVNVVKMRIAEEYARQWETSEGPTQEIVQQFQACFPNGESATAEAKSAHDQARDQYAMCLNKANEAFSQAFDSSFDPRYGARLMQLQIELGDVDGAAKTARLVRLACKRDGGLDSENTSNLRAFLEASICLGAPEEEIQLIANHLLETLPTQRHAKDVLISLERLLYLTENPDLQKVITRIEEFHETPAGDAKERLLQQLRGDGNSATPSVGLAAYQRSQQASSADANAEALSNWRDNTYSYRGKMSNSVQGNFAFEGILPSQNVNRYDRASFDELLHVPLRDLLPEDKLTDSTRDQCLADIEDPEQFIAIADAIIRSNFNTDTWDLEVIDSAGHKEFERRQAALIQYFGFESKEARAAIPESRTNVFNVFAMGIGDCRQQAHVKQLMFDTWQAEKVNKRIQKASAATDPKVIDDIEQQIDEIQAFELRTFDCICEAPIQLNDQRLPVRDENGKWVLNEEATRIDVEPHTLNVILKKGAASVGLSDVFYKHTYSFGEGELPLAEGGPGHHSISAGTITCKDPKTGEYVEAPVKMRAAEWAGPHVKYNPGSNTSRFCGRPLKPITAQEAIAYRQSGLRQKLLDTAVEVIPTDID